MYFPESPVVFKRNFHPGNKAILPTIHIIKKRFMVAQFVVTTSFALTFLVIQLWLLACHRLVGVTTCLRALPTNPVAETALFIVMYFRELASTLHIQLSVGVLLGVTEGVRHSVILMINKVHFNFRCYYIACIYLLVEDMELSWMLTADILEQEEPLLLADLTVDNLLLSTTLGVLALAESSHKRLSNSMLALITYTMNNVFWVVRSNK